MRLKGANVCSWDASVNQCKMMPFTKRDTSFWRCQDKKNTSVCLLSPSYIGRAMEVSVKNRACGQSHVSFYSLWVVPWGAVWLFWDNLLITIQYGPLVWERVRANGISFFLLLCEWTDYMSKSRHLLSAPTLKSRRVRRSFLLGFTSFSGSVPKSVVFANALQMLGRRNMTMIQKAYPRMHTWKDSVCQPFVSFDMCVWREFGHSRKRWCTKAREHWGFGKRLMKYHHIRKCLVRMTQLSPKEIQRSWRGAFVSFL